MVKTGRVVGFHPVANASPRSEQWRTQDSVLGYKFN